MDLTSGVLPEMAKWQLNQLVAGQSLLVSKAIHQATIEWDEEGATAAAATAASAPTARAAVRGTTA